MQESEIAPLFPATLLNAAIADRVAYFENDSMVEHPNQTALISELNVATSCPTTRNLVLVIGPTGVGKSTLMKLLNKKINASLTDAQVEAHQIGSLYIELRLPKRGAYDFAALHREALVLMDAPLVDRTRPIVYREVDGLRIPTLLVERELSSLRGEALERRFCSVIANRKPRALLLDEGGALFKIGRHKSEADRLERLKTQAGYVKDIANSTKSTVVIGGAYDFFDLSVSSGQNARRTLTIHVRPYPQTESGITGFAIAITGLLSYLPVLHRLDPAVVATELFLQALGCVGTAAGILCHAMKVAVVADSVLTMAIVRKCYYPASALQTMRAEMTDGMKRVDALLSLEELLPPSAPSAEGHGTSEAPPAPGKPPLKPGETAPSHMAGSTGLW